MQEVRDCRTSRCSSEGVKFYAALGNHDDPNQRFYKPFNMNGERLLHVQAKADVRFFALDSNYMDREAARLAGAGARQGSKRGLEDRLLPPSALFVGGGGTARRSTCASCSSRCSSKHGVNVVFAGHEHFYERIKPQKGIHYFTARRRPRSCARATSGKDRR